MSYAVAQPPPAKRRPGAVGAASALLYLSAALLLISAAVGFVPYSDIKQVVSDFYANDPTRQQAAATGATIGIIVTGIVYLLIAVGFVVLGSLVGKGASCQDRHPVIAGLGVLCLGCGGRFGDLEQPRRHGRRGRRKPGAPRPDHGGHAGLGQVGEPDDRRHRVDRHGDDHHPAGAAGVQ
jgi:hypothetical protein